MTYFFIIIDEPWEGRIRRETVSPLQVLKEELPNPKCIIRTSLRLNTFFLILRKRKIY